MQCSVFFVRWLSLLLFTLRSWGNFNSTSIEFYYNFPAEADTLISLFIIPFTNYIALFITTFFHQRMTQLHVRARHPKNIIFTKTEIENCKIMKCKYKKIQFCTKFTHIQCKKLLWRWKQCLFISRTIRWSLIEPTRKKLLPTLGTWSSSFTERLTLCHLLVIYLKRDQRALLIRAQILLNYMHKTYIKSKFTEKKYKSTTMNCVTTIKSGVTWNWCQDLQIKSQKNLSTRLFHF